MPRCSKPCKRVLVGLSWVHLADGSWKRLIIRECFQCREREASDIHHVNSDTSVCSWCFGQDITVVATDDGLQSRCVRCGRTDMWLLVAPTPVNPLEDDSDEEER